MKVSMFLGEKGKEEQKNHQNTKYVLNMYNVYVYTFGRRDVEGSGKNEMTKIREKTGITLMRLKVYWWPFGSYV